MSTSNRLASLRKARGWSRKRLAQRLFARGHAGRTGRALHERTVYRWETGESTIPDPVKAALADLLGVSIEFLMGWDSNGGEQEAAA